MWSVGSRLNQLRYDHLPKFGAFWQGSDAEFVEYVHKAIGAMPEPMAGFMNRYYIIGDAPRVSEDTGKTVREDGSFYNVIQFGRQALAARLLEAQNAPELTELLRNVYGR